MVQVWLVTGSSRGLGREIVEAGLAAGNKVLATARDIKSLADLSERYGDQVKLFAMDVTDEAAATNAVMSAIDLFGSLDVVINNAGYGNLSSVEDTPLSEFRAQIETNLFGTIIVTKAALRYFREKKAGHSVFIGGRKDWPSGTWPLFGGEVGCRRLLRGAFARSGTARNPVAFAQTSRAVPQNLAKVILNTIRRLELPQDFNGTTTASSLVTPKRQLRRSSS
jgi:NAD(P)-dependent dehydrogenase (short-subunit alcohol dehydrogenase family)